MVCSIASGAFKNLVNFSLTVILSSSMMLMSTFIEAPTPSLKEVIDTVEEFTPTAAATASTYDDCAALSKFAAV